MSELKPLIKLSKKICREPAKHVNSLNQLIPGLLSLIDSQLLDQETKEKILNETISLFEAFT